MNNFDYSFYGNYYDDLKRLKFSKDQLLDHYIKHGKREGRICYDFTNVDILSELDLSEGGVNVFGYFSGNIGLSHNAIMMKDCLESLGLKVNAIDVNNRDTKSHKKLSDSQTYKTNIWMINPDADYRQYVDYFKGTYNVTLWAWELNKIPASWKIVSKMFNRIWTISNFCKQVLESELNRKVDVIRIPGRVPKVIDKDFCKKKLGLENKFIFSFCFDSKSIFERKNPLAVVKLFEKLSLPNSVLILKTKDLDTNHARILKRREDIIIVNRSWSEDQLDILMNATDVYLSLHRSEGSGLTIMEAILLGKPVLCTGYSGNLDFIDDDYFNVNHKIVNVDCIHHIYSCVEGGTWAEPDLEDAYVKLSKIVDDLPYSENRIEIIKRSTKEKFNKNTMTEDIKNSLYSSIQS